jgi:hypothetical protein
MHPINPTNVGDFHSGLEDPHHPEVPTIFLYFIADDPDSWHPSSYMAIYLKANKAR